MDAALGRRQLGLLRVDVRQIPGMVRVEAMGRKRKDGPSGRESCLPCRGWREDAAGKFSEFAKRDACLRTETGDTRWKL